jgi:hypothetical protein
MPEQPIDLKRLGRSLLTHAYPEFNERGIVIETGKLRSYGQVRWSDTGEIQIMCHQDIVRWPEPAVIGLLAHEISHPAIEPNSSEEATDRDVISRGLGYYLAVERVYDDHRIGGGRDRYLGFQSIRKLLNSHERCTLENLLEDFNILPGESTRLRLLHDTAIHDGLGQSILMIEGQAIQIEGTQPDSELKLLIRDEFLYVYADEEIVAQVPWQEE